MTDYIYNRNQITLGPGMELNFEFYRDRWRNDEVSIPQMLITMDIKGLKRNSRFDEVLRTYPDAQMIEYFDPNTHKIAEMSGNKNRHLVTIFLLRNENDLTNLREKIVLASQWNEGLKRTVARYWDDPRYHAYHTFSNVPVPSRAYTSYIDINLEPGLAMEKEYLEIMKRFLDLGFFIAKELD